MKTKKLFFSTCIVAFIFAFQIFNSHAQAPGWSWAKSAGGSGDDRGNSIATDTYGNVFTTGYFRSSSILFGTDTLFNSTNSSENFFIAKYDPLGNELWAKSAGGTAYQDDEGISISTDANGNVYVVGLFVSHYITFGTDTLWNASGAFYASDIFIVKYNGAGNMLWAKSAGGTNQISDDRANSISIDAQGNVYVTGWFNGTSITFDTTTVTKVGTRDIFIVKYDSLGTVLWTKSAGGPGDDSGNGISSDTTGNVYVTGTFMGASINFGTTVLTKTDSTQDNVFIVKYSKFGNLIWAKSAGGSGADGGNSVCTDANGNLYVTGYFNGNSTTFETTTLTPIGSTDIFIVKYNSSGTLLWAKSEGAPNPDISTSVFTDVNGNLLLAGYFYSPSITFGTTTLTKAIGNYPEIFIVKYDASGNVLWAKSSSTTNQCAATLANSVSSDANGNIYSTGGFSCPTVNFGSTVLTNNSNNFTSDMYISKLGTTTGIKNVEIIATISLYPNPASDFVTLIFDNTNNTDLALNIYNVIGDLVKSEMLKKNQRQINIENLSNGIYIIEIQSENWTEKQKLIIQR